LTLNYFVAFHYKHYRGRNFNKLYGFLSNLLRCERGEWDSL